HPEDRDAVLEEFSRSYKLVDPLQIDHRVVFPDGRLKYVTERWQVFHDDQGRATRALGTVQDITEWAEAENERVLAEESLRESEERYRTTAAQLSNVLDSSLDLICSFDIDGRFLRVNAACLAMLGYTVEEMLGSLYLSKVLPEDLAKTRAAAAAAIAGRSMRNFENRYQRKDGGICVIQWAAHWSADEETMFCVGRDVTEHKQLEAQFLRAQRMESIGTLAGGIAHDINNILAPIMLSIELLKMDEHDPMHLDVLSTVERSSQRGADMVRQLLSFARGVERDQVQNQLGELIREVEKILTDTFLRTVAISVDVPDDLWPVQGDPTQLHQVLMNLVVNARDAMPNGGSLTVTARNVQLDGHEPTVQSDAAVGPYVVVSVSDTGTGMDERVLDRAFEPFFTT
ncbi:MAG: PAS domain S-box protein, partial [Actinomycetota bacterium]|nr:PAS domain S-box protein [Actinomycetota bacterium]